MTDYVMADEMEDDLGDFDAGGSTNSDNEKVDSILIKKILCEMKSEFNRATCSMGNNPNLKEEGEEEPAPVSDAEASSVQSDSKLGNGYSSEAPEVEASDEASLKPEDSKESVLLNSNGTDEVLEDEGSTEKEEEKPRIILTLRANDEDAPVTKKKIVKAVKEKLPDVPSPEENTEKKGRRSLRNIEKCELDLGLKRSSRRMSRESVLQSAIALKEKSFGSLNSSDDKPHRRSLRFTDGEQKTNNSTTKGKYSKSARYSQPEVVVEPNNSSVKKASIGKVIRLTHDSEDSSCRVEVDEETLDVENESFCTAGKSSVKVEETTTRNNKRTNKTVFKDMWADSDSCSNSIGTRRTADLSPNKGGETSLSSKNGKTNIGYKRKSDIEDVPEEKKQRYPPSPSTAEGSEPPVSERIPTILMANSGSLCECQTNNELYPGVNSFSSPQYCKAIDTFESRHIGCCNLSDSDTPLLRPSKTVPHLLLCKEHIQRLLRHNACPSCGLFCTQGIFMLCNSYHYYHKGCELKKDDVLVCPHCGSDENQEVKISLGFHKYPVFLPMQKPPNKYPSARMSFSNGVSNGDKGITDQTGELIPEACLLLPSGRKITSEGIPTMEKEKLEKLLHAYSSQNVLLQRFTYRNLYQAAKNGQVDKIIQILGTGINPNQVAKEGGGLCALHAAAGCGHLSAVHTLVQAGANPDVLDRDQYTPLMLASLNRHNDVVKYLIKAGASVSFKGADGMTALHIAAKEGNVEACHYLLSSANSPQSYVDTVDDGRWTPLVWAAENCCMHVVRLLLENKADPQIRDSEMNIALHWAAFAGSMEITEDLLNYGSNINLSNTHGDTPLHIAARQGAENCVILLLARGARVDMMNKAGQVPRDCALDHSSYCYTAIDLNMLIKRLMVTTNAYPRILCNDISRGYESNPIQCVNAVDDDGIPTDFTYITENCLTTNLNIDRRITSLTSCKCEDMCTGAGCLCAKISFRCWYDSKEKLLPDFNFEDPPMIFECNQTCDCNALTCKNRVAQRGIKVRMQLCKTRHKNWGVITLKDIPKGTYVCEYIGEIISDCEADTREDDSYLFDLDSRDGETYCIDARRYGNIARFINHSCKPNLSPVRVFIGHHDLHFPRIAFFANRDILANEELGFDYGEKFWIIKCKSFTCMCAADNCRYSETKIQETLEKYKEKLKLEETLHT